MKTYVQAMVYSVKVRQIAFNFHTRAFLLCLYVAQAYNCIAVRPTAGPYIATVTAI
jgi:hypothetical protein